MKKVMKIEGIQLTVEKKAIKNMYIRVKRPSGEVMVSVPKWTTDQSVREFVSDRAEWIKAARERILIAQEETNYQYVSGEMHSLWGEQYELCVVEKKSCRAGIRIAGKQMIMTVPEGYDKAAREVLLNKWYRRELSGEIEKLMQECVRIVGREPDEWHIRNMKTKWGTCNILKKRIWINLQLVKKPRECLKYVLIHELTHFYERNHDARFKAYMNQFYPNWREVKKRLNGGS